jgi:hypothetical protein
MGLFSRKTPAAPAANPAMAELGRQYAIAKRHGDRKAARRIADQAATTFRSEADADSFQQGQQSYDAIPPAYSKPRKGRRNR